MKTILLFVVTSFVGWFADVEKLDFTSDKRISRIKISVDCSDGFKGTNAQMVFKNSNSKISFYRIYDEKAESYSPLYNPGSSCKSRNNRESVQ